MRRKSRRKGAIICSELLFLIAILVIGSVAGMYALQNALNVGMNNMANSIQQVTAPPGTNIYQGVPCGHKRR